MNSIDYVRHVIHSATGTGLAEWTAYKADITGAFPAGTGVGTSGDLNMLTRVKASVVREFNRKCFEYGHTGIMVSPYNEGFVPDNLDGLY